MEQDVRDDNLELVHRKEASGAASVQAGSVSLRASIPKVQSTGGGDAPCMLAVAEGDELGGGVDELVLERLALLLPRTGEAERVERAGVGVVLLVEVRRALGSSDEGALGDDRAVDEGDVLARFAS